MHLCVYVYGLNSNTFILVSIVTFFLFRLFQIHCTCKSQIFQISHISLKLDKKNIFTTGISLSNHILNVHMKDFPESVDFLF